MLTTVFVADDHAIVRDGLVSLLRANGLEVVGTADNGRDAIDGVLRLAPRVVVMDISMPDISGIDAARAIRAVLPEKFDWPAFVVALALMSARLMQPGRQFLARRPARLEIARELE